MNERDIEECIDALNALRMIRRFGAPAEQATEAMLDIVSSLYESARNTSTPLLFNIARAIEAAWKDQKLQI